MELETDPRIAKLYRNVPDEAVQKLQEFRNRYPCQMIEIRGYPYRFIDTREGESTLLMFVGGTSVAEVSFQSIQHFAKTQRVIAPDYPPIDDIKTLFEGYLHLLDHLGIESVSIMGGSYGGWMAQSFVRMYPKRVDKMVLTAIGPPNPENSRQIAGLMRWLKIAPMFVLRALISRSFSRLQEDKESTPEIQLLWALVKEVMYYRVQRPDIMALMERLVDQTDNYEFTSTDLDDWPGEILILCGSEDPSTPLEKRQALKELYPQAHMEVFDGGEHGIAISHQEKYFSLIDQFLLPE